MNSVTFKSPVAANASSSQGERAVAGPSLAAFAPPPSTAVAANNRKFLAMAGAAAIQAVFILGMISSTFHKPAPPAPVPLQINLLPDEDKKEPPPPPMKPLLMTPTIVMNLPVMPQIYEPPPLVTVPAPPTPNAPAATTTPVSGNPADIVQNYQIELLRHLNRNKRYPATARAKHEQGVVYVRFSMDRQGRVLSVAIDKGSRYPSLNDEGLALLTRAQPLPAPPTQVTGDPLEMIVPVEFSLKGL